VICTVSDQMQEKEMGWSCGTCGGEEGCIRGFYVETYTKRETWTI